MTLQLQPDVSVTAPAGAASHAPEHEKEREKMYQDPIEISRSLEVLDQLDEAFEKNGKQYDTNGKALVAAGQEIQRLQGWIKSMGRELDEKDRKINALRKELGYPW